MKDLVDLLIEKRLNISTCESFTAGLFAYELGRIPGVSAVFRGSLIAYQSEIKERLLNIDPSIFDRFGVVSQEMAEQMARSCQQMFKSDVCVSFTGNAGPEVMEGKVCGLWYACVRIRDDQFAFTFQESMQRNELQVHAVEVIKNKIIELIRDMPN